MTLRHTHPRSLASNELATECSTKTNVFEQGLGLQQLSLRGWGANPTQGITQGISYESDMGR